MEVKKAWVVFWSDDGGVGSSRSNKVCAIVDFNNKKLADSLAVGKCSWGGNGRVVERNVVRFGDIAIIVDYATPQAVLMNTDLIMDDKTKRANALAKLTIEDRRILGIKE